jgi:hypothetical protein
MGHWEKWWAVGTREGLWDKAIHSLGQVTGTRAKMVGRAKQDIPRDIPEPVGGPERGEAPSQRNSGWPRNDAGTSQGIWAALVKKGLLGPSCK